MTDDKGQAVLFIGANRAQATAMEIAAEMGLHTVATDRTPEAPGATAAGEFVTLDGGDTAAILALARRVHTETPIVAAQGVADFAFDAVGAVNEALGLKRLPTRETYARMVDKGRTRARWARAGLPIAPGLTVCPGDDGATERVEAALGLPVVVKPLSGHRSRGVVGVSADQPEALARVLASVEGDGAVVEADLRGRHVNVDGLMIEGALRPVAVIERLFATDSRFQCRWSLHPAALAADLQRQLFDLAQAAARALDYRTGPLTVDMVLTDDGPHLLEASPHFHDLHATVTLDGGDGLRAWYAYLTGRPVAPPRPADVDDCAGACRIFQRAPGRIERVVGLEAVRALDGVIEVSPRKRVGDRVDNADGRYDICAVVWVRAPDHRSLEERLKTVEETLVFETAGMA